MLMGMLWEIEMEIYIVLAQTWDIRDDAPTTWVDAAFVLESDAQTYIKENRINRVTLTIEKTKLVLDK